MQYKKAIDLVEPAMSFLVNPPLGAPLTRLKTLHNLLGGLRPHEVTLLCAGTGAGKTSLLATIAADLVEQGIPTFVAPVETGDLDFVIRTMSVWSKEDLNIGQAQPSAALLKKIEHGLNAIKTAPLFIANYDNRVSVNELKTVIEFAHTKNGIRVVLLDNLNFFLEVVSSAMEKAEMDNAIHELVMFAKKFPIHTILVVHPRKTEHGKVVSEYDIKGSSTAVQECANVLLFNRMTDAELEETGLTSVDREFVFRKIRRRGLNVGKKFYMTYLDGRYADVVIEKGKTDGPNSSNASDKRYSRPWND